VKTAWRTKLSAVWEDGDLLAELYEAIPNEQRTPTIIFAVSMELEKLGMDGIRHVKEGLRRYPSDFWLHFGMGRMQKKTRTDAAIGSYRTALAIRPRNPTGSNNLGILLRDNNQYAAAIAAYEDAIGEHPKLAMLHNGLGTVLHAKKEYDAAIAKFQVAIQLEPYHGWYYFNLAKVRGDKGEFLPQTWVERFPMQVGEFVEQGFRLGAGSEDAPDRRTPPNQPLQQTAAALRLTTKRRMRQLGRPQMREGRPVAESVLRERSATIEDMPHLPYTAMVVKESLRLYPPLWGLMTREAVTDAKLGGYEIPKGSWIVLSPYVTHRDPRFFANPDRFDPERFAAGRTEQIPANAYFPFGAGPHSPATASPKTVRYSPHYCLARFWVNHLSA